LKYSTSKIQFRKKLDINLLNYFKKKKILLTSASIHPEEENFSLLNHLYFKKQKKIKNLLSIIVPRHVQSKKQIVAQAKKLKLKYHLHSSNLKKDENIDIYIVDTYGDLQKFYQISNLVFIGGSLINHGGQNPLEAVKLDCKIIHGPNIANFKDVFKTLSRLGLSSKFNTYKAGYKLVERNIKKTNSLKSSKKLMRYGDKILIQIYKEVLKIIK